MDNCHNIYEGKLKLSKTYMIYYRKCYVKNIYSILLISFLLLKKYASMHHDMGISGPITMLA